MGLSFGDSTVPCVFHIVRHFDCLKEGLSLLPPLKAYWKADNDYKTFYNHCCCSTGRSPLCRRFAYLLSYAQPSSVGTCLRIPSPLIAPLKIFGLASTVVLSVLVLIQIALFSVALAQPIEVINGATAFEFVYIRTISIPEGILRGPCA